MEHKPMKLENVGGGVLSELFARELELVEENMADANTSAKAKRRIALTVEFTIIEGPGGSRRDFAISCASSSKLAPVTQHRSFGSFGTVDGKPRAFTNDVQQESLDLTTDGVTPMKGEDAKKEA
jgi:hypothetical protein